MEESKVNEWSLLMWFGDANYQVMQWANTWYWPTICGLFFLGSLIGMTPLKSHHEHGFIQISFIFIRKTMLWIGAILIGLPFVMLYIYDMTTGNQLADSSKSVRDWFWNLTKDQAIGVVPAAMLGWFLRVMYHRYIETLISKVLKKMRKQQTDDEISDIRKESEKFQAKDFSPAKHYKKGKILIGLNGDNKPIHVPLDTWRETNTQLIGPTRYGKGVIIGCLIDQSVKLGDACIYIDPKKDTFAPHIMYAAAKAAGKPFYYVALHDDGPGSWAPFAGGSERDGLARMEMAFGLQETGDPGTDFYKTQEKRLLAKAFKESRSIVSLAKQLENSDANKLNAQLERWAYVKSLCPKSGRGFSIEKALKEGAVVYVQGSLTDDIVKTATKMFIVEVIQEAMRLKALRTDHLTMIVDEVRFLVSKQLADALATVVGFRVNVVTAYQSMKDIEQPDDTTLNGKSLAQSININSQIKAVYGGADFDTAEWAANLSGTITKEITRMEGTDIRKSGGEIWQGNRYVGTQEENLINTNMVLSLPPRVCVFVQPRELVQIAYTSFVPVKDTESLDQYLEALAAPKAKPEKTGNKANPVIENDSEETKPAQDKEPDDNHMTAFADSLVATLENPVSHAKQDDNLPTDTKPPAPTDKPKETVSQAKPAKNKPPQKKKSRAKGKSQAAPVSAAALAAVTSYMENKEQDDVDVTSPGEEKGSGTVALEVPPEFTIASTDTKADAEKPLKDQGNTEGGLDDILGTLDFGKLAIKDDAETLKALDDSEEE